jgi:dolichol-phosphate mannosyltransferase
MTDGPDESLALLVPVGDEPEDLATLVAKVEEHVSHPFTMHVVFVSTAEAPVKMVRHLAATRPWLRMLDNSDAPGVAGALRTGFRAIRQGPALVTMPAADDDLSVVPRLRALYAQGYQIVCPSRFAAGGRQIGGSAAKQVALRTLARTLKLLTGFPIHDLNNNFRLYDAHLVNELRIESPGGAEVAFELAAKAFRRAVAIAEVPVTWTDRRSARGAPDGGGWVRGYLRWYLYALRSGRPQSMNVR